MNALKSSFSRGFSSTLTKSYSTVAFPEKVDYMGKVNDKNETLDKPFLPWFKLPKHEKNHSRMRHKQIKRMKRGLEAYHPVNNSLISMKLDAYSQKRRTRFAMILFDSVVERGGFFSHTNYKKFLKAIGIRGGCFEEAVLIFNHYKQSYPESELDITVYNQMIQVCRGNPKDALKYYSELVSHSHMIPSTYTFNYLLQSLLKPYRRHTILKSDEVKEMNQERAEWGAADNEEIREYAEQILNIIHEFDSVILANSYVQATLGELVKLPVFSSFEPVTSVYAGKSWFRDARNEKDVVTRLGRDYLRAYNDTMKKNGSNKLTQEEAITLQNSVEAKYEKEIV